MSEIALLRHTESIQGPPAPSDVLGPGQIIALLRRNWLLIVICGAVFAGVAYTAASKLLTRQYTSAGLVAVDTQSVAIPALEGALKGDILPDPMPIVRSEVEVLQSPSLIRSVVDDLKLEQNPEFNTTLRPPSFMSRLKSGIEKSLPRSIRNQLVDLGVLPKVVVGEPLSQSMIDDITVGAVRHKLSVNNDGQSLVITVQFSAESPQLAAAVVNGLIQHYMANKEQAREQANRQANSTLTARLNQVRDDVNALEQKIQQTRQRYEIVQTRAGSVSQQQLEDLSSALTRASAERAGLEANYSRATALASAGEVAQDDSQILSSATISALREREAAAERRVAELSQMYGPGYPSLRAAEAQLASARRALAAEARRLVVGLSAQVQASRQREADIKGQLAAAQAKASQLATVQAELAQLQKDADARRALYQSLLVSAEQTSKGSPQQVGSHIVSLATPPAFPSSPRPKLAAAFGMVAGFAFGGFIALLRRRPEGAFDDPEEIAAETGLETLATIPHMRHGRSALMPQVVANASSGPEAEALRLVRAKLRRVGRGPMPRTLLFAASVPGEGASSIAAAFARLAALDGMRVLLIEGDLHNPSLSRLLEAAPNSGVIDTLLGYEHWREALGRDPQSGLEYLFADGGHEDAGRLLESMQLQNLLAEAKEDYNFVVLDAQAVSASPDAMVMAHVVDATVLVVAAGANRDEVRAAIDALAGASRRPPAIVLNEA